MSLEDGVFDQEVMEGAAKRLLAGGRIPAFAKDPPAHLTPEQIEELVQRALRASNWRHRILGHPGARLFIHRHHLVTTYPDGRVKLTGPGRAS